MLKKMFCSTIVIYRYSIAIVDIYYNDVLLRTINNDMYDNKNIRMEQTYLQQLNLTDVTMHVLTVVSLIRILVICSASSLVLYSLNYFQLLM